MAEPAAARRAALELEDGTIHQGTMFGQIAEAEGELVFNTGMVGYVESLTDPSYRGQVLILTYPMIGNYGVPNLEKGSAEFESDSIQVRALVVQDHIEEYSHWQASMGLGEWLSRERIVGFQGADTRALTKRLREKGTMLCRIVPEGADKGPFSVNDPNGTDLVSEVSSKEVVRLPPLTDDKGISILVMDCGCKRSIVRELRQRGCEVIIAPYNSSLDGLEFDGVMLSNGPGDPAVCTVTIGTVSELMRRPAPPPIAGICLGNQIMALSAGGRTFKLPFGHRSQNQPCRESGTGKCVITSQNHGYAVDPRSLPEGWKVWFTNLNDGTVEGIRHEELPFMAVQFHPEASPGPVDYVGFFDSFLEVVKHG